MKKVKTYPLRLTKKQLMRLKELLEMEGYSVYTESVAGKVFLKVQNVLDEISMDED